MGLVTTNTLLEDARKHHYAVPALNVENLETIQGVMDAAQKTGCPVIIQTTPSSVQYGGLEFFAAAVRAVLEGTSVTAALHLDHGSSFELAVRAMKAGYTSVMIDGSKLPFAENIQCSKKTADVGHIFGVPVEAELGCVGGKEDETESAENLLTIPEEAQQFVRETGIDSLAVAIGTAHGFYKGIPNVNVERLKEIHSLVDIPLVLHGTSGVPEETVKECIQNGICKVNYATDLRQAFTEAVRRSLKENPDIVDPKAYLAAGRKAVAETAEKRIKLCME